MICDVPWNRIVRLVERCPDQNVTAALEIARRFSDAAVVDLLLSTDGVVKESTDGVEKDMDTLKRLVLVPRHLKPCDETMWFLFQLRVRLRDTGLTGRLRDLDGALSALRLPARWSEQLPVQGKRKRRRPGSGRSSTCL